LTRPVMLKTFAEACLVHRNTVSRWIRDGKIEALIHVPGRTLIEVDQVDNIPQPEAIKERARKVLQ